MALNPDFLGKVFPPDEPYVVGREKVREFALAIGDHNPSCHDVAQARSLGHADVVAPPTFAIMLALRAADAVVRDPGLGLDYTRVVHGDQRFAYARALTAGDEVVTTTTIESIREAAGNDILLTRADIATVAGEHVVSAWTSLVARAKEAS